ncbi:uncharacterized protein EDB91DRAFT_1326349 [Suillus paluster]|uniref:uncharacterized protein n=1 Tax=Suillus paluster TaxID=48578 RepID=UPI001B8715E4|nr:uncharacterized protein EDB91DRAFT_1326349 [Suillus paluster]KAG1753856.1 hypothetical protein EDB91DRAFT_1326349 [Suillus paluster]
MSDAQAAHVTENGVPPAAQEYVIEEAPALKVFAGNLAYSTTDEGLKSFFAPVQSDIISAQVILRGPRSAGYGFVTMSSEQAAQRAVELLNSQELEGRKVIVEIAKPSEQKDKEKKEKRAKRRPNRRGAKAVPGEVTDAEANGDEIKADDSAAAAPGTDEAAKPKRKKKKSSVCVEEAGWDAPATDDAPDATASAPRKPRVRKPRAPRQSRPVGEDPVGEPSKTMLFVANLGFSVDDDTLATLFTEAGIDVISARVVRRHWGTPRKSKGYGFVDVGSEEEQVRAIELVQGKEVGGRAIAVKIAVNSARREVAEEADRRQMEQESREEGLGKSLFERAQEEEAVAGGSKALGIMMKMGFKVGQSLGKIEDRPPKATVPSPRPPPSEDESWHGTSRDQSESTDLGEDDKGKPRHQVEPLPLNEWQGKKGIGLGKRARSPSAADRLAKMAKMAEAVSHESFRDRARREYEERRAEGRLAPARRTCLTLDEKAGITFNVLCLNPNEPESIPQGLMDPLSAHTLLVSPLPSALIDTSQSHAARLHAQMRADALLPVSSGLDDEDDDTGALTEEAPTTVEEFPQEVIEEAAYFLRLGPRDRLKLLLDYLREKYAYCFWCGTQYEDSSDLAESCPGPDEDDHD